MKKNILVVYVFLVAVLFVSSPLIPTFAAQGNNTGGGGSAGGGANAGTSGNLDQDRNAESDQERNRDRIQEQEQQRVQVPTSSAETRPLQEQERDMDRIRIQMENAAIPAGDGAQLRQMIQERERELNQEASSTPEQRREIIQNENQVRLAVHAMLASETLLGGIGPRVAELAREMNNSAQATINAETSISSRGFWANLFFGGDRDNAQALRQELDRNRLRIQELKNLLERNDVAAELQGGKINRRFRGGVSQLLYHGTQVHRTHIISF